MDSTSAPPAGMHRLIPMLAVSDMARTIDFYTRALGFEITNQAGNPPVWCMLKRDNAYVMFNAPGDYVAAELPRRAKDFQIYYFYPKDVRALHAELKTKGVEVSDLRVTEYCMREFELRDPEGYWIWFGEETTDPATV